MKLDVKTILGYDRLQKRSIKLIFFVNKSIDSSLGIPYMVFSGTLKTTATTTTSSTTTTIADTTTTTTITTSGIATPTSTITITSTSK